MTPTPAAVIAPNHDLRTVPWRLRDLLIAIAPLVVYSMAPSFAGAPVILRSPGRSVYLFAMAWMLAYPLWAARLGPSSLPGFRRILIEASIALPAALVSVFVMVLLTTALSVALGESPSSPFESIAASPSRFAKLFLVAMAVLVAPFAEEMFFRGMVYNFLRQRMHWILAALIQGIAFGFYHPFSLQERATIAVGGFAMGLLYEWRRALIAPILFHGFVNSLGLGLLFLSAAAYADAPVLGVRGEKSGRGCLLTEVMPGGSAAEAGLRVGDVITGAGENSVGDLRDLVLIMRTKKTGDRIPVWFTRDGEDHQVEAVLKARPKNPPATTPLPSPP
ncbi:CPBP family glutamic-type intramembrane protease [Tundrisphaera lichenicola]|uniref:CPBP family intramembrane glutamic endopeptidase n=1 Tax=Tundrisphaera lichenicola TaxID=2029860 RepID=UPI003EB7B4B8